MGGRGVGGVTIAYNADAIKIKVEQEIDQDVDQLSKFAFNAVNEKSI